MTRFSSRWNCLSTLSVAIGLTATTSVAGESVVAFSGARVFDGERVIPDATVVVRDGIISAVIATAGGPRRGGS